MRRAILRTIACCLILADVHTPSFAGDNGNIPITDEIIFPFKICLLTFLRTYMIHGTLLPIGLVISRTRIQFFAPRLSVLWPALIKLGQKW